MTIELALLLSLFSVVISTISALTNLKRNRTKDDKSDAVSMTTVIVKLETISEGVSEIKKDMSNLKSEQQTLRDRVLIAEQKIDRLEKCLDEKD